MTKNKKNYILSLFFLIYFFLGIFIYKDFGMILVPFLGPFGHDLGVILRPKKNSSAAKNTLKQKLTPPLLSLTQFMGQRDSRRDYN